MRIYITLFISNLILIIGSGCDVLINPQTNMNVLNNSQVIASGHGSFDFGTAYVNNNELNTTDFTIYNKGKKTLELTDPSQKIQISGANTSDFIIDETLLDSKIKPGKTSKFNIRFCPQSVGLRTARISILNNDEDSSPYTFDIKGIGITPEITVLQGNTTLQSGITEYDFNRMYIGYTSAKRSFTIINSGSGDLKLTGAIDKIILDGFNSSEFTLDQSSIVDNITPGASTIFTIAFNPTSVGNKTASITISNSDIDEDPFVFKIKGVAIDPGIVVQDSSHNTIVNHTGEFDFGGVLRLSYETETFTIKNLGSSNLELTGTPRVQITGSGASNFLVTAQPTSPIMPNNKATFNVRFVPSSKAIFSATVTISNNDNIDNPYVFELKGEGLEPEIEVKNSSNNTMLCGASTHNFGDVTVNKPITETFTIYNTGNADLKLTATPSVTFSGSGSSAYSLIQNPSTPINPGSSTTFVVEFNPSTTTIFTATVSIPCNDLNENPFTFTVKGNGVKPEINVRQGSIDIPCNTGSYFFGTEYVGQSGQNLVFTIENLGSEELKLTGNPSLIEISGTDASMFIVNQTSTSTPISPSNNTTFTITYKPTSPGNKTATISIANDDADENPYTFIVTGTAIPASPEINIKQDSTDIPTSTGIYSFPGTKPGESSNSIVFTIENIGVLDLNLSGNPIVNISGPDSSEFSLDTNSTSTPVSPGSSTTFSITFKPTGLGNKSATISITNNDTDENPYTFTIQGKCVNSFTGFDFNGDGINDTVIGVVNYKDGGSEPGAAFIFFGKTNMPPMINSLNADVKIIGTIDDSSTGYSVSSAGDFNNDGFSDVIIGAPDADVVSNRSGCAYIIFGSSNPSATIYASNADIKLIGSTKTQTRFGCSVSSAQDFNSDGYADVIVGAELEGYAYIFFGSKTPSSEIYSANANVILPGGSYSDDFGFSVSKAGDFNNDGYDDVIVGAHGDDDKADDAGCAFIYFGSMNPSSPITTTNADVKLMGVNEDDMFGYSVSTAGDFNKDGYSDVIVGAHGVNYKGGAFIFFGSKSPSSSIECTYANIVLSGESDGDQFGITVSIAGDLNSDGYSDVMVTATARRLNNRDSNSGCVFIFLGSSNPSSSISAGNADSIIEGVTKDERFGIWSLSAVGDINSDGFDDLIAGASGNNDAGTGAGCAYIFYGKTNLTALLYPSNANVKIYGSNAYDRLGCSVGGSN